MTDKPDGIEAAAEYDSDLFQAATIERILKHFQIILEVMGANAKTAICSLPLLNEREQYQLLSEWNDTARTYPSDSCVPRLFEEQAASRPEAIALTDDGNEISYAELNRRANQLAHYLRAKGVGAESMVGLALERGFDEILATLGILKAGGSYVPLDLEYPVQRLTFMIEDIDPTVIITRSHLVDKIPLGEDADCFVLFLEDYYL